MSASAKPLLQVQRLSAQFTRDAVVSQVVKGISFDIAAGEAVGFVGESGCGKSVTARAMMRLAPEGSSVELGGVVRFDGQDLLQLREADMCDIRGQRIAMVFQDPMTSLNPVLSVGAQIDDIMRRHTGVSRAQARRRTVELLAMAVSCQPDLLIADEPTTALDVTVQAQILRLLLRLRQELGMALMLITHDFGVIAGMVERVYVMLDGQIVEAGAVDDIFARPQHAYTRALLDAVPRLESAGRTA